MWEKPHSGYISLQGSERGLVFKLQLRGILVKSLSTAVVRNGANATWSPPGRSLKWLRKGVWKWLQGTLPVLVWLGVLGPGATVTTRFRAPLPTPRGPGDQPCSICLLFPPPRGPINISLHQEMMLARSWEWGVKKNLGKPSNFTPRRLN